MNPHRLAYGFAYNMPFAQITALVLMGVMVFSKEVKKPPINSVLFIWVLFIIYMGLTTSVAFFPEKAFDYYIRVIKIQLIVFLTMMLITDLNKLIKLIWVIVMSIGYYSVKGGVFTLLTGGGLRVWGPADSFIEGNNELAVATLMVIPLMYFLYMISKINWVKKVILMAMAFSFVGAIGTQSRGALLAFVAVVMFFWIKSNKKFMSAISVFIVSIAIFSFMPESWYKRMDTIQNYEEDGSAMGRLNAWEYAYNLANENFFGMGFDSWDPITFAMYAPNPLDVHAAHSIYFSVLADHGWIGLLLFILIFFQIWRKLGGLIMKTNEQSVTAGDTLDINILARMLQVSFIAYFVGGAFLSLSYFDLPWHLISFVMLIDDFYRQSTIKKTLGNLSR